MSTADITRCAAPSLRRLWTTTMLKLIGVVLGLGLVAIGSVSYVHSSFSASTTELERQLAALSEIDVALLDVSDPAGEMM